MGHERIATSPSLFGGSFGLSELDRVNSFHQTRVQISPLDNVNNRVYTNLRYSGGIYNYKNGLIKWADDVSLNQNDFIFGYDYENDYGLIGLSYSSKEKIILSNKDNYHFKDKEILNSAGVLVLHRINSSINIGTYLLNHSTKKNIQIDINRTTETACYYGLFGYYCVEANPYFEFSEEYQMQQNFNEYGLLFNHDNSNLKYGFKIAPERSSIIQDRIFISRKGNGLILFTGLGYQNDKMSFEFNVKYEKKNKNSGTGETNSHSLLYEHTQRNNSHGIYYSIHSSQKLIDGTDYLKRPKKVQVFSYEGVRPLKRFKNLYIGGGIATINEDSYEFGNEYYDMDYPKSGKSLSIKFFVMGEI